MRVERGGGGGSVPVDLHGGFESLGSGAHGWRRYRDSLERLDGWVQTVS